MTARLLAMGSEEAKEKQYGTLENRFSYHPPTSDAIVNAHQLVRAACLDLARTMQGLVPPSCELEESIECIELAMYHANAGIARISNY